MKSTGTQCSNELLWFHWMKEHQDGCYSNGHQGDMPDWLSIQSLEYLDDLQLHPLVGLRPTEAATYCLDNAVNEALPGSGTVREVARQVAIGNEFLET